jgi:hypothetical protein
MPRVRRSSERPTGGDEDIAGAIRDLAEEVRVLRQAVDELREEVQYGVRNLVGRPVPPRAPERTPVTVQVDAEQFGRAIQRLGDGVPERLNRQKTVHVEAEALAEAMEDVEELVYCCAQPKLVWYGDPDRPGIACENCGFPVAHEGDILCWQGPEEDSPTPSPEEPPPAEKKATGAPQRELF